MPESSFLREVWTEYGIGTVVLLLRFFIRIKTVGFKGFQGDDYFSIAVLTCFTGDAILVHFISVNGTNLDTSGSQASDLTSAEIKQLEWGSKLELMAWFSYTALIWQMKGTILCFFKRITVGLPQEKMIRPLAIFCAVSYAAVLITLFFGCRPFSQNWRVIPAPSIDCGLRRQNFIVTTIFNVLTDAAILCVPVPLFWGLRIPLSKKTLIGLLLSSGLFVITAAIIRTAFSLVQAPSNETINRWGVRETLVGIVAVNAPIIRPVFDRSFWRFRSPKRQNRESRGRRDRAGMKEIGGWDSEEYIMGDLTLDLERDGETEWNREGRRLTGDRRGEVLVRTEFDVERDKIEVVKMPDFAWIAPGNWRGG